ncbi:MAG TPA: hypothetical protein VIY08_07705, partial [Candidatus Nitrosocosmicus sp.]
MQYRSFAVLFLNLCDFAKNNLFNSAEELSDVDPFRFRIATVPIIGESLLFSTTQKQLPSFL